MQRPAKTLRGVAIFKGLSEDALRRIEQHCTWKVWKSEENIVHFQDDTRDVFFLITGRARVIIYSVAGKPVIFRDIGPGDIFGEFASIDDGLRSATVEAINTCLVACMTAADFRRMLRAEAAVMEAVLIHAVAQMRALTARIFEFSTLAVNNRIHAELLRLANGGVIHGVQASIFPIPTHVEIASRISTHREAVAREMNRLVQIELIERSGSKVLVKDIVRLTRMVHDATGE
jgi:CRP/FNR family cyclic AMP-dependent transcriptional regulator